MTEVHERHTVPPYAMRGAVLALRTEKACPQCNNTLSLDNFCRDKSRVDGRHPWCRPCASAGQRRSLTKPEVKARQKAYQRDWAKLPEVRQKNLAYQKTPAGKAVKRRAKLKAKYGLTEQAHAHLLESQGGVCGVCKSAFKSRKHTHTDHCHRSGMVRGILCHDCNRALGAVKDSPEILRSLIAYLDKARST